MRLLVLAVIAATAGCASQPQTTRPSPTVVAAAPAPAPAAAPATAGTVQAGTQEPAVFKPLSGYRIRKQGDVTVYCKKDTILGSRFPEEFCFTEDQLKDVARRGEDIRQNKVKTSGMCGGVAQACGNQ